MDKYEEQMKKHRSICCIMFDFMKIVYQLLVFITPSTISDHKRGELIVGMNELFKEMKYYTEGRE